MVNFSDDDDTARIKIKTTDSKGEIRAKLGITTEEQRTELAEAIEKKMLEIRTALKEITAEGEGLLEDYEALERIVDVIHNFDSETSKLN